MLVRILVLVEGLLLLQHNVPRANSFKLASDLAWGGAVQSRIRSSSLNEKTVTALTMARGGSSDRNRPWNFFRFLQQSSRFVSVLPPSKSVRPGGGNNINEGSPLPPGTVLWTAGDPTTGGANIFTFAPLDDVVMGGASSSTFDGATGKWRGTVTDANNGGFVGIRSTPYGGRIDLSRCKGIEWTLAGTAEDVRLKVVLRDSDEFNGVGWTSSKDTTKSPPAGARRLKSFVTLKIPFRGQVPCRFAKIVSDAPPFNTSNIKAFQLVYSKFEYDGALNPKFRTGDFEFQLQEIRTY
jgi:Complex I intermediate-associated protein 30 (CIA30)